MGLAKYTKDDKDRIVRVEYPSGIDVKTVYGPEDLERVGFSYGEDLADPGKYPFTRGIHGEGTEKGLDNARVLRIRDGC